MTLTIGEQTVPDDLIGCWRRNWIQFSEDGERETEVTVIWLQTTSGMGDLRLDAKQPIERNDSSCGITIVEPTTPLATADWLDGETGFAQQPVSSFPEKGWLRWESPTLMHELAPSGAYVEEWEKLAGSEGDAIHLTAPDATTLTNLYIVGQHHFLAIASHGSNQVHEFSYGVKASADGSPITEHSTIETLVGSEMQLDFDWTIVSRGATG